MYDVIVIGGGAAGMLSSALAAQRKLRVLLLEKNEYTGKKLRITGKGRCNLTNNCSVSEVLQNIPTGSRFLNGTMNRFTPQDTMELFEHLGVKLKTERGNRVFPESDKASEIVSALRKFMKDTGVSVRQEHVLDILTKNNAINAVVTDKREIACKSVILCTGGISYPLTGSTGDGYRMAARLGHKIIDCKPSLVPLVEKTNLCGRMQGLSLKNVQIRVYNSRNKIVFQDFGELLFTHFGLSGPLILSASSHMRDFEHDNYYITIDLKPALTEKMLDARILRDFEKYANRDFGNALGDLANRMMIPILVERSEIPPETKVHSVTREQRVRLNKIFKEFRVDIEAPRPISEAIITSGGIDLKEINPKTMESKLVQDLYFAGEVIDADAYTGGFNLQIAWATAHAAGMHVLIDSEVT